MIRELALLDVYYLVLAIRWTIGLTVLALLGGGTIGLLIAALGASRFRVLRGLAFGYVGTVQGIPLLGWLFIFYFGLSIVGYNLPPLAAATIGRSALLLVPLRVLVWWSNTRPFIRHWVTGCAVKSTPWPSIQPLTKPPQAAIFGVRF